MSFFFCLAVTGLGFCVVWFSAVGCFVFFPSNIQYRTQENFCVYEITGLILLLWACLVLGKETRGRLKAELYSSKPARIPLSLGRSQRVAIALAAEKRGNKSGGEILRRAMHTSLHYEGQWKLAEDLPPGEGLMFFPSFSLVGHPEGRRWFICLAVIVEPFFLMERDVSSHDSNWAQQGNFCSIFANHALLFQDLSSYMTPKY